MNTHLNAKAPEGNGGARLVDRERREKKRHSCDAVAMTNVVTSCNLTRSQEGDKRINAPSHLGGKSVLFLFFLTYKSFKLLKL